MHFSFSFEVCKTSAILASDEVRCKVGQSIRSAQVSGELNGNMRGVSLNHMGPYINLGYEIKMREIEAKVKNKFVHLQFDSSPLHLHLFNVVASYWNNNKVENMILASIECSEVENHIAIRDALEKVVKRASIDPNNVVGLSCDRASNNTKFLNVHTETLFPNAVHLRCLCHVIHTCMSKLKTPIFDEFLKYWNNLTSRSSKFRTYFKEEFGMQRNPPVSVETRWGSRIGVAKLVWELGPLLPPFFLRKNGEHKSANLSSICHLLNDKGGEDFTCLMMEAKVIAEQEKLLVLLRGLEGDGIRALWAADGMLLLRDLEKDMRGKVRQECRMREGCDNLDDRVWRPMKEYIDATLFGEGAELANQMNLLNVLSYFNPFFTGHRGDITTLVGLHFPLASGSVVQLQDEKREFLSLCQTHATKWRREHDRHQDLAKTDEAIYSFMNLLMDTPTLPLHQRIMESVICLQTTSAATERSFSHQNSSFTKKRKNSKQTLTEYELMAKVNDNSALFEVSI